MVTLLFVLGVLVAVGIAVWAARSAGSGNQRPGGHSHYLDSGSSNNGGGGDAGRYGAMPHDHGSGSGWSDSGGGGGDSGGGGGGS